MFLEFVFVARSPELFKTKKAKLKMRIAKKPSALSAPMTKYRKRLDAWARLFSDSDMRLGPVSVIALVP